MGAPARGKRAFAPRRKTHCGCCFPTETDMFLPHTSIEIVHRDVPRGRFRSVLFDFDGTISLIRQGWQDVMIPMMVEVLSRTPKAEPPDQLTRLVQDYVARSTGIQTIYQMMWLAEQVEIRGGKPADPLAYKHRYNELLLQRIRDRIEGLRSGRIKPEEMLVPAVKSILQKLRGLGCILYCASGTDEKYMRAEAELLGVSEFFNGGLYGATDDFKKFSKKLLIERIIAEHGLSGSELLTFGDGFVEIENTKHAGGVAVGVAFDEKHRQGLDAAKRQRLIAAGADIIIPHYQDHDALVDWLFARE